MKKTLPIILIICLITAVCSLSACSKKREDRCSYDIFAQYDEDGRTLTGTVNFEYYNSTDNEINDLKFNLYGNAFREGATHKPVSDAYSARAYYDGASYGGMEITGVENCAGWNLGGEDENLLTVNLLSPVYPGERYSVTISYILTLAKVNHRTGVTKNAVNLGNFYPVLCAYGSEGFIETPYYNCGDPFISDCADYKVTVDMPETSRAAARGEMTNDYTTGGRRKSEFALENARDFALVLSDKFQTLSGEVNGVKVNYYYFNDGAAQASLDAATSSLDYFQKTFGDYIYPTLSVVQTGFCYGGMEYPGLTMIAEGQSAADNIYTIVHENAHQWWYAMVGSDQVNSAWQDEGLAEYSTLMYFENHPAYGLTRTAIVGSATRSYRAFFSVYSQLNGEVDTSMTRNLKDYQSEFEYSNVTYNKGIILFDTLRNSVGDEKFVNCLRNYYSAQCGKIAGADDLIAVFVKAGGDTEGLFNSFLQGKIII